MAVLLKVDWKPFDPPREWYFYTNRMTVWRVLPGDWTTDALIGFTFEEKAQDFNRFRNAPYWRERFGDTAVDKRRFNWTRFYEAVADKLLTFRNRRDELISGIHAIASKVDGLSNLQDQFADGSSGPLKDICPFTVMGIFNRGITDANRKVIASELASLLGVSEPVPDSFEGFRFLTIRGHGFSVTTTNANQMTLTLLWEAFAQAIAFAESDDADARSAFVSAYDNATQRYGVGWNLTMGLYWIRPWNFPTLDGQSQRYIGKKLNIQIGMNGPKGRCNASDYLAVLDASKLAFKRMLIQSTHFLNFPLPLGFLRTVGHLPILMPQTLMRRMTKRMQRPRQKSRPHLSNRTPSMTFLRMDVSSPEKNSKRFSNAFEPRRT